MRCWPHISFKLDNECLAGELIRPTWKKSPLAIVMRDQNGGSRFAVILEGDERNAGPYYTTLNSEPTRVISYGTDYTIAIDPNEPCDVRAKELWDVSGAIHVSQDKWLIRVRPAHGLWQYGEAYFDLKTGTIDTEERLPLPIFGRWWLEIEASNGNSQTKLFEFSHSQ